MKTRTMLIGVGMTLQESFTSVFEEMKVRLMKVMAECEVVYAGVLRDYGLDFLWDSLPKQSVWDWIVLVRELMQDDDRVSFHLYHSAVAELDRLEGQLSSEFESEVSYDLSGPDGPLAPCDGWHYEE